MSDVQTIKNKIHLKNKKNKLLYPKGTKVKVKDDTNIKLLKCLEEDYLAPNKCKGKEGHIISYLDIGGRSELYPIVKFDDGQESIFFENNLKIIDFLPEEKEKPPIKILEGKKLPSLPKSLQK